MKGRFIKVNFKGQNLWFPEADFLKCGSAPLALPDHCDDEGNLVTWHGEASFAHVYRDGILRYGKKIGIPEDLKDGWVCTDPRHEKPCPLPCDACAEECK